jgi:hypothetical protein
MASFNETNIIFLTLLCHEDNIQDISVLDNNNARHDKTEILLKMALYTINLTPLCFIQFNL